MVHELVLQAGCEVLVRQVPWSGHRRHRAEVWWHLGGVAAQASELFVAARHTFLEHGATGAEELHHEDASVDPQHPADVPATKRRREHLQHRPSSPKLPLLPIGHAAGQRCLQGSGTWCPVHRRARIQKWRLRVGLVLVFSRRASLLRIQPSNLCPHSRQDLSLHLRHLLLLWSRALRRNGRVPGPAAGRFTLVALAARPRLGVGIRG
mmetsp:Transcript_168719/g.542200  ORF Transcript_168719/g.542200 Transcript_168719/m.542200 type:complete len:208 (-) Transcript_168719:1070-1693(-)